jgi:hypothetical protein
MSEVALAHKYSSETYEKALSNVVDRWEQGGDNPVKYDEAAIGMDTSTVSTSLKFLAEIGLLDAPKAGRYNVPEMVVKYRNKFGEVQQEAKKDVESMISDYPVYDEAKFLLEREQYTLDELAEAIAGSSRIAANKDELGDVKRSLKILAELDFLEMGEEGGVSLHDDLCAEESNVPNRNQKPEAEFDEEAETGLTESKDENAEIQLEPEPKASEQKETRITAGPKFMSNIEISVDLVKIESDELREKLKIIKDILSHDET